MQSVRKKTVSFLLTLIVLMGIVAGIGLPVAAADSLYLTKQPKSGTCDKSSKYTITWEFNTTPRQVVMQNYNYKRGTWSNGSDVTDQTSYSFVYIKGDYLSSDGANKHRLCFMDGKTNYTYYSDEIIITWTGKEPRSFWTQPKGGTCDKSNPYTFSWELGEKPYHVVLEINNNGKWLVERGLDGTSYSVYYQERATDRYRIRADYGEYVYSDEFTVNWTGKEPRAFWLQPESGTCAKSSEYTIKWNFGGFAPDQVILQVYLPDFNTWADIQDVTTVASYSIPYSNHESDIYRLVATWNSVNKTVHSNSFEVTWKNKGWVTEGGKTYYYDDNENKVTGWKEIGFVYSGHRYYEWFYFDSDGVMQTGWVKSSGSWYYLGSNGAMRTGWQQIDGEWYYLGGNGAMRTNWQQIGGIWYYLGSNGVMRTGWQQIGGVYYYFKSSGAMAANEYCGGYWLSASGAWTYKHKATWRQDAKGWWFGDETGWYAKNETLTIDDKSYTFDSNGYWIE